MEERAAWAVVPGAAVAIDSPASSRHGATGIVGKRRVAKPGRVVVTLDGGERVSARIAVLRPRAAPLATFVLPGGTGESGRSRRRSRRWVSRRARKIITAATGAARRPPVPLRGLQRPRGRHAVLLLL